jgi:Lon protease-like protein
MTDSSAEPERFSAVPLFPLPNVVLFPRAVLPLHIFEERYRAMTSDVINGLAEPFIAMALLKSGWERDYYSKPAIEQVVCIGKMLTHEKLPDGKFNFLLQGVARAKIVREIGSDRMYRIADLERLEESPLMEIDLSEHRQRLVEIFSDRLPATISLVKQFRQMLSSTLPTADIADLIAFNMLDNVHLKQSLLEETNVKHRVDRVMAALEGLEFVKPVIPPPHSEEHPNLN